MLETQPLTAEAALGMLVEAMESMTFVSPFPADDAPPFTADGAPLLRCTIGFGGGAVSGGELTMVLPQALATVFAVNLLDLDPDADDAPARAADCAAEIMNVMCGRLLASLPPAVLAAIEMRLPMCAAVTVDADATPPAGAFVLDGDGQIFWIAVSGLGIE